MGGIPPVSLTADFARLFDGLRRSFGRYVVPAGAKATRGKLHDRSWARTVHGELSLDQFDEHLKGTAGLGVVPIRDDATCVFGAIDLDPHDEAGNYIAMDLKAMVIALKKLKLPVVLCRTKSGGAHLYLFLKEPIAAEIVRGKLMEWAVALGDPDAEVFPKQARLASERDDGSWINLPYFGGRKSTRYAVKADGSAMTVEEFIKVADEEAISQEALVAFSLPADESGGDDWTGAPPCLQTLSRRGFGDWQNNGLFNVAVYLRKRYGDGWEAKVDAYNQKYMSPAVGHSDVAALSKSVGKKTYSYMCKQQPICGVCNRSVCLTREYGVGGLGDDPGVVIGGLVKVETDPPVYIADVNAFRLELNIEDLLDQRAFRKIVAMKLDILTSLIKPSSWDAIVRSKLASIEVIKVPEDATKEGQFWGHVQQFCTSKVKGRSMDELLLHKPFTDPKEALTYFRSADLIQYLTQNRFNGATEKDVWKWLRKRGAKHHFLNLKGQGVNCWSIPSFESQTEEHEVPRAPPTERM